jgi:formylglycine-generating enzyme required for sulfatase activity
MTLLYVPAGEFKMGIEGQEIDEKPVHTVYLDTFWIDQTEVTNAMYALCADESICNRPSSNSSSKRSSYYGNSKFDEYPVIHVTWEDARTYCEWADRRLPTEAEWEKAARGLDQRTYPWKDDQIDCSRANYFDGNENKYCFEDKDTSPVKYYKSATSPYGVYDMAGNVWEWVADWYGETYYKSLPLLSSNPIGPTFSQFKVARGGSWYNGSYLSRTTNRGAFTSNSSPDNIGFRCVMSASK